MSGLVACFKDSSPIAGFAFAGGFFSKFTQGPKEAATDAISSAASNAVSDAGKNLPFGAGDKVADKAGDAATSAVNSFVDKLK